MKTNCQVRDKRFFERTVQTEDTAIFEAGQVHPVYATFALARDAEWVCRQFVLEMKEDNEEGIGTFITVDHLSPALVGDVVKFEATLKSVNENEIVCDYKAEVGNRLIASGEQGQKILEKDRITELFEKLRSK